jgi:prophage regulatory protein
VKESPTTPAPSPLLVREKNLPALLGISRGGVRSLLAAGKFPQPIRLGRRCIAWRRVDLEAWVAGGCGRVEGGGNEAH